MKEFEMFLVVSRGLQAVTIQGYMGSVKRMMRVLGTDPTHEQLNQYIYDLYSSNYSYAHKTNTALGLERWTEFKGNPIQFGRQKRPRSIIKNTLTEAEITTMLFNCRDIRQKAFLSLLAYSGIRNLELCKLKVKDVLITQNAIRVINGKGLKDGISQVAPECTEILIKYLNEFPRGQEDYLFTTLQKGNRLGTGDVRKWIKIIAKRARIEKRVYPHLLRASMACNMLLRGADIVSLKTQLRHSWLDTTLVYINSIVFVEKNSYQKHCPVYI